MDIVALLWLPIAYTLHLIERLLFLMITLYDAYCYSPLQKGLSPIVARLPRTLDLNGRQVTVFTANIVSFTRTALVVPIAYCLKYGYPITAFFLVMFHDFLDHVDGIVAKVHKAQFGQVDDPLLGGFMDAFCDKIVNCLSLWTILLVTDFSHMTTNEIILYVSPVVIIIAYEFILGVVRVQDYFQAYYFRELGRESDQMNPNISAIMEGKLKEKLESLGIGFLCLAHGSWNSIEQISGVAGIICLVLSIRLAHASLAHKLKPRRENQEGIRKTKKSDDGLQISESPKRFQKRRISAEDDISETDEKSDTDFEKDEIELKGKMPALARSRSVPSWNPLPRVDKVYTVGCFDLFHDGHRILIERMKALGKQVVVGVHDSRSIFELKNRVPIEGTTKRMANVKQYADIVFCIHGTDPTPYLQCIYDANDGMSSLYARGDDMPHFPARKFVENVMPVHFLPYTAEVSSTKIRKDVYSASMFGPHAQNDDHVMFY